MPLLYKKSWYSSFIFERNLFMKTTVGLLIGIAVGIGIGMLLAPDKGSETRKKLSGSADDLFEKLKRFISREEVERADVPQTATSF